MLRIQIHRKSTIRHITESSWEYNKHEKESELIGEQTAKDVSIYDVLVSHCFLIQWVQDNELVQNSQKENFVSYKVTRYASDDIFSISLHLFNIKPILMMIIQNLNLISKNWTVD